MTQPFLRSYSKLLIQTCHKRGAHGMGGMAAQIPIKNDDKANEEAIQRVRNDKTREATDGHDGTWVAHPGLVPIAMEVFDELMPEKNQVSKQLDGLEVTQDNLLEVFDGFFFSMVVPAGTDFFLCVVLDVNRPSDLNGFVESDRFHF